MSKWQILIVDNSEINVAGLGFFLRQIPSVDSINVAATLKSALTLCDKTNYDLILLNLCIQDYAGFDFLERLIAHKPKTNVLTFSDCCSHIYALKVLKIGAKGYFSTDIPGEMFIKAVELAAEGNKYIDTNLAQKMALQLINGEPHPSAQLTTREFEVFRMLSKGMDSHQIAAQLFISYKTACNYVSKIREKLNVHNNVQLMNLAHEYGFFSHEHNADIESQFERQIS